MNKLTKAYIFLTIAGLIVAPILFYLWVLLVRWATDQ